ncbi:single-stranded DNA-binding protein [Olivibacter domesticus]|uniref:Single-strand DNA-binding protein n=1 Tax=Olivibacter domesticus TaxID=407022 RepID=A0A1H7IC08_OLID1|nr:single-stranded DNA-binding protein [Olivibacter domesticus]SEK60026.1 single-strand DNA-binding protein [Olivibacter domesticus]
MKQIFGTIQEDAVITSAKGKDFVKFTLKTNAPYYENGERKRGYHYYNCAFWRSTSVAQYLTKGKVFQVFGNETINAYVNKQQNLVAGLNFHVEEIEFPPMVDRKKQDVPERIQEPVEIIDDLPF